MEAWSERDALVLNLPHVKGKWIETLKLIAIVAEKV